MANKITSTIAITKSGSAENTIATIKKTRSNGPRRTAVTAPRANANGSEISPASSINVNELTIRPEISALTGPRVANDVPKLPVTIRPNQCKYWLTTG